MPSHKHWLGNIHLEWLPPGAKAPGTLLELGDAAYSWKPPADAAQNRGLYLHECPEPPDEASNGEILIVLGFALVLGFVLGVLII